MTNNFLQSEEWRKFQEAVGRRTFSVGEVNIIEHKLPIVGSYFYVPKGEISQEIIELAKKEKAGWIRVDIKDIKILEILRNLKISGERTKVKKAPHNMQPREIFVINITKSEEELLSNMKPKTRYNIKLAEKKRISIKMISNSPNCLVSNKISNDKNSKYYIDKFIELISLTAKRKGIKFHPEEYYRKMIETIDSDILSLYVAEYNDKVIAANLVAFYGNAATYLHGATDDEYRNVMAPYLLQWQAIKDAKAKGCKEYDMGGIKTVNSQQSTVDCNNWSGITKFKLGFSTSTKPLEFPGSYDIILSKAKYAFYVLFQKIRSLF